MAEIVMHLANSGIDVKQLLELYKDFNRISKILTQKPIAIEELFKIWKQNQRFLEPICSSAFECIQKLVTDTEFRNDVLAKIEFCTKWVWRQIIVKSAKGLLVQSSRFWNSLIDIIKQRMINDEDIKIQNEFEMIEQKIERLRRIVIELEGLIVQFEECDVEDTNEHGQLFKAIETKITQVLQEEVIQIEKLKKLIIKYQTDQINTNEGSRILKIASAIGVMVTIVYPPSYFLTAAAGGVSAFVISSILSSCTSDKVKELSQQLTLLEAYKREYEETMQEIRRLSEKKNQVAVAKLMNLAAGQNASCTCGGCKCQQI